MRGVRAVGARRLRREACGRPLEEVQECRRVVQQEPREHAEGGCGRTHMAITASGDIAALMTTRIRCIVMSKSPRLSAQPFWTTVCIRLCIASLVDSCVKVLPRVIPSRREPQTCHRSSRQAYPTRRGWTPCPRAPPPAASAAPAPAAQALRPGAPADSRRSWHAYQKLQVIQSGAPQHVPHAIHQRLR